VQCWNWTEADWAMWKWYAEPAQGFSTIRAKFIVSVPRMSVKRKGGGGKDPAR